jgi:hypothetical protein
MSDLQNKKDFQDYLVDPWVRESQAMELEALRMRVDELEKIKLVYEAERSTSIERNLEIVEDMIENRGENRVEFEAIYNLLKIMSAKLDNLEKSTYHRY